MLSRRFGRATLLGRAVVISTAITAGVATVLALVFWAGSEILSRVTFSMPPIGWYCIFLATLLVAHRFASTHRLVSSRERALAPRSEQIESMSKPNVVLSNHWLAPTRRRWSMTVETVAPTRRRWSMTVETETDGSALPGWRFWLALALGLGGIAATIATGWGLF